MSPNTLFRLIANRPFEPFRLFLSNGTYHNITHPEMIEVGTRTSTLYVPPVENPESADREIKMDNLHITKTIPLSAITTAG